MKPNYDGFLFLNIDFFFVFAKPTIDHKSHDHG